MLQNTKFSKIAIDSRVFSNNPINQLNQRT
ncbi:hypothetical protein M6B38_146725 [Iris pallida]|uniref:Uncharacterized protein n=1 Tax=Iris pallida TaxID=29817 RepID=A0AAX6F973_IRIPA|nr:hypothetical protein M6B38_146725 [Iris pallida]